ESESVGVGVGEAENAQAAEDVITDILPLVDPKKQEAFKALEELWDSESRSAEEKKSVEKKEKREDSEHTEKLEYSEKIEQVEAYPLAPVQTQIAQHGGKEGLAFVITDKEGDLADKEGTTADGIAEGAKEKVGVKKVLLVILVIVLLLEMAALGLKYLAPNSIGAAFVNRYLKFAVTWVDDLFRKEPPPEIDDFDKDQGAQGQDTEDITDADNGEPANAAKLPEADKAALVAGQLGSNRNIVTVEAKDELKYNAANTYSDADIGSSKPIEDNVWRTFEGNDVLYDQSVVASLISFNSKWIDFVNSGDESILEVVKKGGQAEKSILDYKRGSGVKKTFKLLQIGEIRQNGNIFFIWAHEMIQDTANGKTTENSYDWIYRMEAVDDKMLVTGYFRS
ncbi:MAG: hypothetical protein FWG53_07330, partial [Clostridiales bacterium]|nr:hypothetical protein [Clostridiales bacterium]